MKWTIRGHQMFPYTKEAMGYVSLNDKQWENAMVQMDKVPGRELYYAVLPVHIVCYKITTSTLFQNCPSLVFYVCKLIEFEFIIIFHCESLHFLFKSFIMKFMYD
jgi:hypothetical protein